MRSRWLRLESAIQPIPFCCLRRQLKGTSSIPAIIIMGVGTGDLVRFYIFLTTKGSQWNIIF